MVPHILALRPGATLNLDWLPWSAVTTFPSFHSTMAVVFAWALCALPYVRWLDGIHYLWMIAGAALALFAIPASQWLMGQWPGAIPRSGK